MTGNEKTIETAEDLLRVLDEDVDLAMKRRRDLKSAVNRFCDLAGCPRGAFAWMCPH